MAWHRTRIVVQGSGLLPPSVLIGGQIKRRARGELSHHDLDWIVIVPARIADGLRLMRSDRLQIGTLVATMIYNSVRNSVRSAHHEHSP
jgi:hypothetical protein